MSILQALTGGKSAQDLILKRFAKQAAENGIKKITIDIAEDGSYTYAVDDTETVTVKKSTFDFLKSFFDNNKNNLQDGNKANV